MINHYKAKTRFFATNAKHWISFLSQSSSILVKLKTVKGCKGNLCRAYARPGGSSLPTVFNLTKIDELWDKKCAINGGLQCKIWRIRNVRFSLHKEENSCFKYNFWFFSQLYNPNWNKMHNYKMTFQIPYREFIFSNLNISKICVRYVLSKKTKILSSKLFVWKNHLNLHGFLFLMQLTPKNDTQVQPKNVWGFVCNPILIFDQFF